jgi:hypothetical protein
VVRSTGFRLIWLCFFLSGATGLIYQVVWLRMLGLRVPAIVIAQSGGS